MSCGQPIAVDIPMVLVLVQRHISTHLQFPIIVEAVVGVEVEEVEVDVVVEVIEAAEVAVEVEVAVE